MDNNPALAVALIVGLAAFFIIVRVVARKLSNKANDAVKNAWNKHKETVDPPRRENLADRYAGQAVPKAKESSKFCPHCGQELKGEPDFCPSCGGKIGG